MQKSLRTPGSRFTEILDRFDDNEIVGSTINQSLILILSKPGNININISGFKF
jgi:hypothetical protein